MRRGSPQACQRGRHGDVRARVRLRRVNHDFGFLYTAISNVFSNAVHVYRAEIFPTQVRSTAANWTYSLICLSTAAVPFLLIPLLHSAGPAALFTVVGTAMVVVALDVGLLGPRSTGRALEQVNPVTTKRS